MADMMIPEGWILRNLADICFFQEGPGLRNWQYRANGFPFINIRCIREGFLDLSNVQYISTEEAEERYQHFFLKEGDYVLSSSGTLGRMAKVKQTDLPLMLNTSVIRFRSIDEGALWQDFLPYYLQSPSFVSQITEESQGSAQVNFGPTHLKLVKSYFPPLPEQQKIATILSSVDTVIEKTRAQIDKLKDLKTGMMQELLTQGIGHTEFKDSPIGRIPKAWKVISLGKAGSWKGGGTPSKANKEFWNGDIPWVSPKDMKSEFIEKTEDYITEHAITASSTNSIPTGSILIVARSGILKHTLPVAIAAVDVTINQDMKALIVNDKVLALYLFHYLQANNHKVLCATLKAGNTVESLDFSEFSQYQIPLPPVSEQQKIIDVMESIANRLRSKQQLLKSYEQTKKALMQDLLTGKVRVNDDTLTYSH